MGAASRSMRHWSATVATDDNLSTRGETSGVTFEEGLMAMAIVTARYPSLQRRARTISTALMLGQARRAGARREWNTAAQYGLAAYGTGGMAGVASVSSGVTRSSLRRRRRRGD